MAPKRQKLSQNPPPLPPPSPPPEPADEEEDEEDEEVLPSDGESQEQEKDGEEIAGLSEEEEEADIEEEDEDAKTGGGEKDSGSEDAVEAKSPMKEVDNSKEHENSEQSKSNLFQKIWSKQDEVLLLKGMIDFKNTNGLDASGNITEFEKFMSNRWSCNYSRVQILNKIRGSKRKYKNNVKRKDKKLKQGHERDVFELSREIWGGGERRKVADGRKMEDEGVTIAVNGYEAKNIDYPSGRPIWVEALVGVSESFLREGIESAGESARKELEESWRRWELDQSRLLLRKTKLLQQTLSVVLDGHRSKGSG